MFQRFHRRTRSNLLALLRMVSKGQDSPPLSLLDDRQLRWTIDAGLGPLLWFVSREDLKNGESPSCRAVKAADLTARLISHIQLETLGEILGRCEGLFPPITLPKVAPPVANFIQSRT